MENDWLFNKEKNGVKLYIKSVNNTNIIETRVTGIIYDVNIEDVFNFIYNADYNEHVKIFTDLISIEELDIVNEYNKIEKIQYKYPIIKNRDFVIHKQWQNSSNISYEPGESIGKSYIIKSKSVEHIKAPIDPKYVRGILDCTIMLTQVTDKDVEIININYVDIKGNIPKSLINMCKYKAMDLIKLLQKYFDNYFQKVDNSN